MAQMRWTNASEQNPGFTVLYYDDIDRPGHRYVIQKKNQGGVWRLAYRQIDTAPLKIIYVGSTEADCKQYAKRYREQLPQ